MKKFLSLFLFFVFSTNNVFGSPLVFTITKEVDTGDLTEIAIIDTVKYRQLRIGIKAELNTGQAPNPYEYIQLIRRQAELTVEVESLKNTFNANHPEVIAKQSELTKVENEVKAVNATNNKEADRYIRFVAIENKEEVSLKDLDKNDFNSSFIIDSPPTKTKIYVKGRGKYTIYIWGQ